MTTVTPPTSRGPIATAIGTLIVGALLGWYANPIVGGPARAEAACPEAPALSPTPTVEVEVGPPEGVKPDPEWPPADFTKLAGKWREPEGLPLPELEFFVAKEGSKTPFNLSLRADKPAHVGCGFYPTGTAFCQVTDVAGQKVPRELKGVKLEVRKATGVDVRDMIELTIEGLGSWVFER